MIFGPPLQVVKSKSSINTSTGDVWGLIDGESVAPTGFPVFIDVRDIAELHVLATTKDVAKNQRYLTVAGHYDNTQIAAILRKNFPAQAHRIPAVEASEPPPHFGTDSSKVEKELGIEWIPFEKSIVDTAVEFFKLEESK